MFSYDDIIIFLDYVCYDLRQCHFFPATVQLVMNGAACRSTKELDLHECIDIIQLFQAFFLMMIKNEVAFSHTQSSCFRNNELFIFIDNKKQHTNCLSFFQYFVIVRILEEMLMVAKLFLSVHFFTSNVLS